jgi:hypothetical protein
MDSKQDGEFKCAEETSLELAGEHRLVLERGMQGRDRICLYGVGGRLSLTIEVTEKGPVLRFDGAPLTIETSGDLAIAAESISLRARQGLSLLSGGSVKVEALGAFDVQARSNSLEATHGDVKVRANDDVILLGERVLVNC